jgi:hypothetical protein
MTVNTAVLDAALRQITAVPEGWNQSTWISPANGDNACGTTMCLAGHVMIASGEFRQARLVEDDFSYREAQPGEIADDIEFARMGERYDPDVEIDPGDEGRRILGISDAEANHLFHSTVDMDWESAYEFADYVRDYLTLASAQ